MDVPPKSVASEQAVRDLKWVINSPSLINVSIHNCFIANPEFEIDASALQKFLSHRVTHRVGHYFEHLVHFYLQYICGFKMLARGLQVQDGSRTVGELDFIFRDQSGVNHHIETAVKFYLYLPQPNSTGSHFVGPNAADTFERKVRHLLSKQLPLSLKQDIPVDTRSAFLKGRMFYRWNETGDVNRPRELSSQHLRGTWIRSSELNVLAAIQQQHSSRCWFRILEKPFWLTDEVSLQVGMELHSALQMQAKLARHFLKDQRPRLVSVVSRHDTVPAGGAILHEVERVFVVDENWPLCQTKH